MGNLLKINNVSRCYSGRSDNAVDGVSMDLDNAEIISIVGESGSGKTTLLRIIAGLEDIDSGTLYFQDDLIEGPSEKLVPGHPEIRMAFQDYQLSPNRTVFENIAYCLRGYHEAYKQEQTNLLLRRFYLSDFKDSYPDQLSGGQQQRLALARALAEHPSLLLFDEPFSSLDVLLKEDVKKSLLTQIRSEGTSAIFVTHDPKDALAFSDKIAVLQHGKLIQFDTPESIYFTPETPYVASLFGYVNFFSEHEASAIGLNNVPMAGIRAEDWHISDKPGMLKGTVVETGFLGSIKELTVKLESGKEIRCQVPLTHYQLGKDVLLQFDPQKVLYFQL